MATSTLESTRITFTTDGSTIACRATATADTITFIGESSANVTLSGITNPSSNTDVANKAYVDSVASGLVWKDSVIVASVSNGNLASDFENGDSLDGVTLSTGQRILIKNQTTASENGIYTVNASGAPTRASDMDTGDSAAANAVFVQTGSTQSDSGWVCTADSPNDIVGTNNLPFVQFNGAENIIAGSGIDKSGNTLSVDNTVVRTSGVQTISGNKTFNSPTVL